MIHGFTNLREYAGKADRCFLTDGKSTVSIERPPCFDVAGPKEVDKILYSKDNTNDKNVKNSLLYHHNVQDGSLSIPSLSVNSVSAHDIDGIYFNSNFEIKNLKIGSQKSPKNIHHQGGSIVFGSSSIKPITDQGGLVDNASIILKYNSSAGVSFPEWDNFLEIDSILENAEKPCLRNEHNLETTEACDDCEDRSDLWHLYEYKRRQRCLNHFQGDVEACDPDESSDCIKGYFVLNFLEVDGNLTLLSAVAAGSSFNNDCTPPTSIEAIQYIKCWLEQQNPSLQGYLIVEGETLTCQNSNFIEPYNPCELFNNLGAFSVIYDMDSSCYNGSSSPCPEPKEINHLQFSSQDPYPLGQGKFIHQRSECYNVLNPEEAKSDCLKSCKSGNNFEVDPYAHWRLTKNGMACENLYGARVDITEYCGCGGYKKYEYYKSDGSYYSEDMSCGWRALMNKKY